MIRLGFRLATAGGREGLTRLVVTVVGVALGVALLLLAAGLEPALVVRGERLAQRVPEPHLTTLPTLTAGSAAPNDALLLRSTEHYLAGHRITVVDVAVTGAGAPTPPGLPRAPGPAHVYLSPQLQRLDGAAFGLVPRRTHVLGQVADVGLADPEELVLWRGWDVETFRRSVGDPVVVDRFPIEAPDRAWWSSEVARRVAIAGGVVVLLVPVVVFIGVMLRLGAMQRQRRLAALSLVGATPNQLRALAVTEGAVVAVSAVLLGWLLSLLARQGLAKVPIGGHAWFPSDLQPRPGALIVIAVVIPVLAGFAGAIAVHKVTTSPLGVAARSTPGDAPRWRAAVALTGLTAVTVGSAFADALAPTALMWLTGVGAGLVLLGMPAAGPWLVQQLGRRTARRARHGPLLIAARRIDDDPAAAFRAASGVVLAVFSVTLVSGYVTGNLGRPIEADLPPGVDAVAHLTTVEPAVADQLTDRLRDTSGVGQVTVVRRLIDREGHPVLFLDCHELNQTGIALLSPCPGSAWAGPGAEPESTFAFTAQDGQELTIRSVGSGKLEHGASSLVYLGADHAIALEALPAELADQATVSFVTIAAGPTGRDAAAGVVGHIPGIRLETATTHAYSLNMAFLEAQRTAFLLAAVILLVGTASLVASLLGGMLAQRNTFVHLRRLGMQRRELRRAVAWQSLLPLTATVPVAAGLGLAVAAGFTNAVGGRFAPPVATLSLVAAAAIVVAVALAVASFPALERSTRPDVANDE